LDRSRYNKEIESPSLAPASSDPVRRARFLANRIVAYFVAHGYAVVVQDVRGRFGSEGHWRLLVDDGNDGVDTTSWIVGQPWSNGKIGAFGVSYEGGTQHALAIANAPGLVTMIPVDAMSNIGLYGVRHNGAFELRWFNWVFTMNGNARIPGAEQAAARAAADPSKASALLELASQVREYVRQA